MVGGPTTERARGTGATEARRGAPRRAPARRTAPLVGDIPGLLRRPLETLVAASREGGDVVRLRTFPARTYLFAGPAQVRHALLSRRDVYRRDPRHSGRLSDVSGDGLTASEGPLWREQRSALRPAFRGAHRELFAAAAIAATERMLARWANVAPRARTVEVKDEMLRLALETLGHALFGVDLSERSGTVVREAALVLERLFTALRFDLPGVRTAALRASPAVRTARAELYRLADEVLAEARATPQPAPTAPLSALLAHESRRSLARDQIVTMVLAGHDTTGAALTWACHLVAAHPAVARRLREDALAQLGADRTPVTPRRALEASYALMVLRETLRLYPPAWALTRSPAEADAVDGWTIPAGATVFLSPYVTHRHPRWWPDAERFEPERFARRDGARDAFAYFPFGAGPRACIGRVLAETTGQVALAMIARAYRLEPEQAQLVPRPRLTLHPAGPVRMRPVSLVAPR